MLRRKAGFFFSLILAFISATGYVCSYTVYAAKTDAAVFKAAAEHTSAVFAGSGMSAPKPECYEVNSAQHQQAAPVRYSGGIDFRAYSADFRSIFRYSPESILLLCQDVYTQFENKYRIIVLILQTLI